MKVLLTGATGYIGGRLMPLLEQRGHALRCLARHPQFLRGRVGPRTIVVRGDVLNPKSLECAMKGLDAAYYLVHSMASPRDFQREERRGAENFAHAARKAGLRRIVYLGGLGAGAELSPHLASRQAVGRVLRESGVPTVELRASIIIGSGSLSFEMVRASVERLPLMLMPDWAHVKAQPIAVEDVLAYLLAALELPARGSAAYEIGGPHAVSYEGILREYARQRGLRRWFVPAPALSRPLTSLWLSLVVPVYARVGRRLVESLHTDTVVRDARALGDFPVRPRGLRAAVSRALVNEDRAFAETRWTDAVSSSGLKPHWGGLWAGPRIVDQRARRVHAPPGRAFRPVAEIGGANGWYCADVLWRLRGAFDRLIGGVGMRRGRPEGRSLRHGDPLDFWRVESYEEGRRLRLAAEMRLPGRAWLEFEVRPNGRGSLLTQTAVFEPRGLAGLAYWYGLFPAHALIFRGLVRAIARRAETAVAAGSG